MNSRPPCKTVWDLSDRILASGELNFTRHLVKRALLINTSTLYTSKIRQRHRLQLIIRGWRIVSIFGPCFAVTNFIVLLQQHALGDAPTFDVLTRGEPWRCGM